MHLHIHFCIKLQPLRTSFANLLKMSNLFQECSETGRVNFRRVWNWHAQFWRTPRVECTVLAILQNWFSHAWYKNGCLQTNSRNPRDCVWHQSLPGSWIPQVFPAKGQGQGSLCVVETKSLYRTRVADGVAVFLRWLFALFENLAFFKNHKMHVNFQQKTDFEAL